MWIFIFSSIQIHLPVHLEHQGGQLDLVNLCHLEGHEVQFHPMVQCYPEFPEGEKHKKTLFLMLDISYKSQNKIDD